MTTVTIVAIVNAVIWSGIILVLLLYLMKQGRDVEDQLARLESQISDGTDERSEA